jgi:hypothetical protein
MFKINLESTKVWNFLYGHDSLFYGVLVSEILFHFLFFKASLQLWL